MKKKKLFWKKILKFFFYISKCISSVRECSIRYGSIRYFDSKFRCIDPTLIETRKGLRGFSSDIEVTKKGKAFAKNQRDGECFEEAGFQALMIQL